MFPSLSYASAALGSLPTTSLYSPRVTSWSHTIKSGIVICLPLTNTLELGVQVSSPLIIVPVTSTKPSGTLLTPVFTAAGVAFTITPSLLFPLVSTVFTVKVYSVPFSRPLT